jgi:hypothetical protein
MTTITHENVEYDAVPEIAGCDGCFFLTPSNTYCRTSACSRNRVIFIKREKEVPMTVSEPKYTFNEFISAYNTAFKLVLGKDDTEKLRKQIVSQTDSEYSEFVRLTEKFKTI